MKKRITALLLMFAILIIPAAAASSYRKQVAIDYGIRLNINGEEAVLKDPNGKTVQPFVLDGTTYVPIRAVSENLGADVSYDPKTNTASVSQPEGEEWIILREDVRVLDLLDRINTIANSYISAANSCMSIRQSITLNAECSSLISSTKELLSSCKSATQNARNSAISLKDYIPDNLYQNITSNLNTLDNLTATGTSCIAVLSSSLALPYNQKLFDEFAAYYSILQSTAIYVASDSKDDYDIWYEIILGE